MAQEQALVPGRKELALLEPPCQQAGLEWAVQQELGVRLELLR